MHRIFRKFLRRDDGAVTIDWVILTGAVVAIAVAGFAALAPEAETVFNDTAATIEAQGDS
ncbi:hypothetical protein DRV85_03895 [Rhodosalinus halophilus]|uniref:Flp pilus assembly protein, pilin Flp n=1 Tax=Rhodosalinus halophilus TaxID=2259333 RepID=A0A365UCZ6_9RHOB|nr:hypothetical protein [Rhodosalinus halophilus]RBI86585.1 hypothetical protein DRV85_03895 [Rhodosalinus halophilus]